MIKSRYIKGAPLVLAMLFLLAPLFGAGCLFAQERKIQNRPYLDDRVWHYGFLVGFNIQDMRLANNGNAYVNQNHDVEYWYADVPEYTPGFSVGVLGEWRLNKHFSLRVSPTLHFGQKHITFHEQLSGRDSTQNIKSTYVSVPVDVKFSAPRWNNFRPYLIAGASPTVDLTTRKHAALMMNPFACYLELGMGCDIYLPFFKLIPELKFCIGLADILKKNRSDLIDNTLEKFTHSLDGAQSKLIVFTLYFE